MPHHPHPQARVRGGMSLGGHRVALVLSGGNALGAYQGGAYQAMEAQGLELDWVVGASAGSVNGAVICGNPAEHRVARLRALWNLGETTVNADDYWPEFDEARRTASALATIAGGQPRMFTPRHLLGPWWNPWGNAEPSSLYDTTPLAGTLRQLVDFDRLNGGNPRFCATAVDVERGEDVVFDTRAHALTPDHLRASSALLPAFPPVEIDGQLLADAGVSANLPLDPVLAEPGDRPLLCIAIDLLGLAAPRPNTLGDTVSRMQDLGFATQSRRTIAAWQAVFDERARNGTAASVTLLHIDYDDQFREVSGKAFDFSPESAAARWEAGRKAMAHALDHLPAIDPAPGLRVYRLAADGAGLERVRWSLRPADARSLRSQARGQAGLN